jgi:glycerol-3-phosphate dehydrogenase
MTLEFAAESTGPRGSWSLADRTVDLQNAEREGLDVLIVGGGITGAGVLRDAASRGLRTLLVERNDFASGTSSRSSKLIHGGLRYIAEGQIKVTREACRERDRLVRLNPHLIRPVPFVIPCYNDSKVPLWQIRTLLWINRTLTNFRRSTRFKMLKPAEVSELAPDLRTEGLRGAGLYHEAHVDDARLVLETLKSTREMGGVAANHAEVVEFLRNDEGRLVGARVRDEITARTFEIRAHVVVNAAGPAVERVRGLDRRVEKPEIRPAKGIHLVIPRSRIRVESAVAYEAADGRHLFLMPSADFVWLGTTDSFTDEIDEPVVTIEEVHYLLEAANDALPQVGLTTNDLCSVYAGVRPLVAGEDEDTPSKSVSREHRVYCDPSGLISTAGGKLTTYQSMGKSIVDQVVRQLPPERKKAARPSGTAKLPLRLDQFDRSELESDLHRRFGVEPWRVTYLVATYGAHAETLLEETPPELHHPIGTSRYTLAEIPWAFANECPATLCDLLEHRLRMALFSVGQGLPELADIAKLAAESAGWDEEQTRAEGCAYTGALRRRYQIIAPDVERSAA